LVIGIHSGSVLAADEERRAFNLIGNSAIGAWTFGEALHELFRQLNSGDDPNASGALAH
jgi:hypothetical protein